MPLAADTSPLTLSDTNLYNFYYWLYLLRIEDNITWKKCGALFYVQVNTCRHRVIGDTIINIDIGLHIGSGISL